MLLVFSLKKFAFAKKTLLNSLLIVNADLIQS